MQYKSSADANIFTEGDKMAFSKIHKEPFTHYASLFGDEIDPDV
jgi:hypothetical protein